MYVNVPCTCTHVRCYAIGCFLLDGVGWGGDVNVPCTCTHVRCYAIGCFLLDGVGWGCMLTFLVLAHMFDATP